MRRSAKRRLTRPNPSSHHSCLTDGWHVRAPPSTPDASTVGSPGRAPRAGAAAGAHLGVHADLGAVARRREAQHPVRGDPVAAADEDLRGARGALARRLRCML
jgi:hypothetical protein